MQSVLFWIAFVDLVVSLLMGVRLVWATRSMRYLRDVPPGAAESLPRVSIVVAARNEERNIEKGLRSLLHLDYHNLEIVVVNDRSTDSTAAVLDRIAAEYSDGTIARESARESVSQPLPATTHEPSVESTGTRLRIVHLTELPAGWLGKNHALFRGASEATGEYLLFTDADIVMEPSVLRRAVEFARREQVDHLALMFRVGMPNWLLESFVVVFSVYFTAHFKPWKVRDPKSKAHVGLGGFNLLRADAYQKLGTHRALAMRPDDDLKLGKLVKKHGLRQDLLLAPDMLYVPWYSSLRELIVGLEKNAFAGVDYSIPVTVISSIAILIMHALPFAAIFFTTGVTRWMFLAVVVILLGLCANAAHQGKMRLSAVLGFPLAVVMFAFIQWRTMILNLWEGGIRWRDTFYPLAELKANRID